MTQFGAARPKRARPPIKRRQAMVLVEELAPQIGIC